MTSLPTHPSGPAARAIQTRPKSLRQRLASRRAQKTLSFYLFITPWLLGLIGLVVIPLAGGLFISFTNYDGLNLGNLKFVGIRNYTRIFTDADALYSLGRVLLWTALNTPLWLGLSFVLAFLLNQPIRGRGFFRTMYYLPSVIPLVAVAWIGRIMLHSSFGLVNQTLSLIWPGTAINWLTEYALYSLTAIAVWTGIGSGIVIFLAGLQGIPTELEEAAVIDGASKFQSFRHITIPLMTPIIFYQLVLSVVSAMQYFALPMLLAPSAGGNAGALATPPTKAVYLFMIHAFRQAFGFQRYGYATALTWFLVVLIMVFTAILFWSAPKWVHYETDMKR
ncbi:MAG: sugar ABC transporter permease [Chloroflexi bacterium]|nr:MAG: sugar ABC transporter permease [Chloroflexota bacterium]